MIYSLGDRRTQIHGDDYFIADSADLIGSVVLKNNAEYSELFNVKRIIK